MNTNASTQPAKRDPVRLGNFTYTALPERAEFRPANLQQHGGFFLYGGLALFTGAFTLFLIATSFSVLFGLSAAPANSPRVWGLMPLGVSMIFGALTTAFIAMILCQLRFWRHPTTFDYAGGVFRRGGQEVCRLSDISEIRLRRITDPKYPGKAKVGLAVGLHDGSAHSLDPRPFFLSEVTDPFTDLGELETVGAQEAARSAAAEVAVRLGVPLKEREERGRFDPPMNAAAGGFGGPGF